MGIKEYDTTESSLIDTRDDAETGTNVGYCNRINPKYFNNTYWSFIQFVITSMPPHSVRDEGNCTRNLNKYRCGNTDLYRKRTRGFQAGVSYSYFSF